MLRQLPIRKNEMKSCAALLIFNTLPRYTKEFFKTGTLTPLAGSLFLETGNLFVRNDYDK